MRRWERPSSLWPPRHNLVDVTTFVTLEDGLSGAHEVRLAAATSDEPDNGLGDGRVYTLAYAGVDAAGNAAGCAALVTVPRDQGRRGQAGR